MMGLMRSRRVPSARMSNKAHVIKIVFPLAFPTFNGGEMDGYYLPSAVALSF